MPQILIDTEIARLVWEWAGTCPEGPSDLLCSESVCSSEPTLRLTRTQERVVGSGPGTTTQHIRFSLLRQVQPQAIPSASLATSGLASISQNVNSVFKLSVAGTSGHRSSVTESTAAGGGRMACPPDRGGLDVWLFFLSWPAGSQTRPLSG